MTKTEQPENSAQQQNKQKRSAAEWVTFSLASLVVATIASLVVYRWISKHDQPPILSINQNQVVREAGEQFYVPFELVNTGGETAESIQVIAELQINGKVEETGEQQIDFLADGETEEGAFVFSRNPAEGKLILRVASYKLP